VSEPRILYRFTRDLRVDDHAGLAEAAQYGELVPVLVVDRALESRVSRSAGRASFACASIAALDRALTQRGARLVVRRGAAGSALRSIARATGACGVAWSASYDAPGMREDQRLRSELEESGLRALVVHDAPAIAPEETEAARTGGRDGYRAFVPYFERWRTCTPASYDVPLLVRFALTDLHSERLPEPLDFGCTQSAHGDHGPGAAEVLERFLRERAGQYALAVNTPGDDGTSRLSAHLSFGTISARRVVRATKECLEDPFLLAEERASLRLFLRSLAMRDFFLQLAYTHPETSEQPLQERMRGFSFARTGAALDAWRAGRTGFPLVDAGIAQLHRTGWMHPRVRAVAASFLCFDLGFDWRVGRDEWDRWLVEDEPALASGNWQWVAGVGADMAQYPRIYNPEKQRRRLDPQGRYLRQWLPEFEQAAAGAMRVNRHGHGQLPLPLFQTSYPDPVVDHDARARAFLQRYRAFMSGSAHA
jgi:deoxyribodipyrimidine photo-lyase